MWFYSVSLHLISPYMSICFLMRDIKGVGWDGGRGKLGGVEGGETIVRIYYVSGKSIFFN